MSARDEILGRATAAVLAEINRQSDELDCEQTFYDIDKRKVAEAALSVLEDCYQVDDVTRQYMTDLGWR